MIELEEVAFSTTSRQLIFQWSNYLFYSEDSFNFTVIESIITCRNFYSHCYDMINREQDHNNSLPSSARETHKHI